MSKRITVSLIHPRDIKKTRKFLTTSNITERTSASILIKHRHALETLAEDWLQGKKAPTYQNIIELLGGVRLEKDEISEEDFIEWVQYIHLIGSGVYDTGQVIFSSIESGLDTIPNFYMIYGECAFNILARTMIECLGGELIIPVKKTDNHDELFVRFKSIEVGKDREYQGIYAEVLNDTLLPVEFINRKGEKVVANMKNFAIKEGEGSFIDAERGNQEFFHLSEILCLPQANIKENK